MKLISNNTVAAVRKPIEPVHQTGTIYVIHRVQHEAAFGATGNQGPRSALTRLRDAAILSVAILGVGAAIVAAIAPPVVHAGSEPPIIIGGPSLDSSDSSDSLDSSDIVVIED